MRHQNTEHEEIEKKNIAQVSEWPKTISYRSDNKL